MRFGGQFLLVRVCRRYIGSVFRGCFLLQHQRSHVREDEPEIERAGTVDVSDTAFAIDEINAQGVVKGTLRVIWIAAPVHSLAVGFEYGLQLRLRTRGKK